MQEHDRQRLEYRRDERAVHALLSALQQTSARAFKNPLPARHKNTHLTYNLTQQEHVQLAQHERRGRDEVPYYIPQRLLASDRNSK